MALEAGDLPVNLLACDLSKDDERRQVFLAVLEPVRIWCSTIKYFPSDKFVNPHLLLDAIVHCQKDLKGFKGPDAFKIGGHLAFWISRIKPFRAFTISPLFTNETLGLIIGLVIVGESMGRKSIPHKIHANLLYDMRYGHVTPSVLANQFQLLYCEEIREKYCA